MPLAENVQAFFEREVKPHVPDAWIDTARRDEKDGEVGIVGYEINFNRYFYRYTPPRPLEEIEADIRAIEQDILRMLAEVAGSGGGRWVGKGERVLPSKSRVRGSRSNGRDCAVSNRMEPTRTLALSGWDRHSFNVGV